MELLTTYQPLPTNYDLYINFLGENPIELFSLMLQYVSTSSN